MTAKRFTITQDFEEHHRQIRDNGHIIMGCFLEPQAEPIVKLLNELHEENQFLKKRLEFFYELNKPYGTIIEENQRLKSFINRLTNDCGEIVLMNGIGYNVKKIFGDLE